MALSTNPLSHGESGSITDASFVSLVKTSGEPSSGTRAPSERPAERMVRPVARAESPGLRMDVASGRSDLRRGDYRWLLDHKFDMRRFVTRPKNTENQSASQARGEHTS